MGASQLSKAAQQRRQEIDNNRAAYATANESPASHATSGADPGADPGPSAAPTGAVASDTPVTWTGASDAVTHQGATSSSLGGEPGKRQQNGHAAAAVGDQASGEEVSSDSSSEGDEAQLDTAGGAEVTDYCFCLVVGHIHALPQKMLWGVATDTNRGEDTMLAVLTGSVSSCASPSVIRVCSFRHWP